MQRQLNSPSDGSSRMANVWMIVLAAATVAAIGMGLRQSMGLYLKPVTETLALGRGAFSTAIAVANLVWGMAAPFSGAVSDFYGTGRVVVMGAVTTTLGLLVMYAASTEVHLLVSGVLLGLGVAGCSVNSMVGAVARAVRPENRTAAIAAIGMGSGVGILIALPYTHVAMSWLGWQSSLLVLAATSAAMLLLAYPLSGRPATLGTDVPAQSLGQALSEAARSRSYLLLNAGFFVCGFHVVFYGTHLPAYVADQGLGSEVAVTALTVVGLGNLVGTYLAGQWGRRFPKRYGLALIYFGRSFVFLGFLFLPITATTIIVLSGLLGLLWLSTVPLTSSLVGVFFGPRWMTMLYGIVFLSHQLGSFLGAWLGGRVFDSMKSYDAMWWISVALGVFAALINWPIREEAVARPVGATAAG